MQSQNPLIVGNWKMNGLLSDVRKVKEIAKGASNLPIEVELVLCVPATILSAAKQALGGGRLALGGQDCSAFASGAQTGEISADMVADCGASYVIVGHSERREKHREDDGVIASKVRQALQADLIPIICVGEREDECREGNTREVLSRQLESCIPFEAEAERLVIAYEPVWAIGSGRIPETAVIEGVHKYINSLMIDRFGASGESVRIVYGGSVNSNNAGNIFQIDGVHGALIGGASLDSEHFLSIAKKARSICMMSIAHPVRRA